MTTMPAWDWRKGALYQVVVPSFMDSSGDGMGDLPGLISRLDYLQWLGVSAIWLTPIYRTEYFDMGYDVCDYADVDPRFGWLSDLDELIDRAHQSALKVLLDFVPNHTSSNHPWFRESRSSRDNPRRDFYLWRDGRRDGEPPSNWSTQYLTSSWTWDPATEQYYMHSFHESQPDLNWRNPAVMAEMVGVLRFWLDRGIDGFRIDAMVHLIKDSMLRDNPAAPGRDISDWPAWPMTPAYTQDQAALQEVVKKLCDVIHEYPDRMVIGENHLAAERLPLFHAAGVTHPVNSQLLDIKWAPAPIRRAVDRYEGLLPNDAWPNWVLGSHDNSRVASRWGDQRVRTAAMLQLTLRGTPIIYYGDELGLTNVAVTHSEAADPLERLLPGKGLGRDGQRSPMPWDDLPNAGFSSATAWLPIGNRNLRRSVSRQRENSDSVLHFYRRLLHMRRSSHALREGSYRPEAETAEIYAYLREGQDERLLVAINFSDRPAVLTCAVCRGDIVLSTGQGRGNEQTDGGVRLGPDEGVIIRIDDQ